MYSDVYTAIFVANANTKAPHRIRTQPRPVSRSLSKQIPIPAITRPDMKATKPDVRRKNRKRAILQLYNENAVATCVQIASDTAIPLFKSALIGIEGSVELFWAFQCHKGRVSEDSAPYDVGLLRLGGYRQNNDPSTFSTERRHTRRPMQSTYSRLQRLLHQFYPDHRRMRCGVGGRG